MKIVKKAGALLLVALFVLGSLPGGIVAAAPLAPAAEQAGETKPVFSTFPAIIGAAREWFGVSAFATPPMPTEPVWDTVAAVDTSALLQAAIDMAAITGAPTAIPLSDNLTGTVNIPAGAVVKIKSSEPGTNRAICNIGVGRKINIAVGETLWLEDITVSGGIGCAGTLNAVNCLITNGSALSFGHKGGGIYISGTGTANLSGCTISKNVAYGLLSVDGDGYGGGIYNDGGTLNMTDCTVSGNSATNGDINNCIIYGFGGGLYNNGGTANLSGCVFFDNTTSGAVGSSQRCAAKSYGGGIYNTGTLNLENRCQFYGNFGGSAGGAIYNAGVMTIDNCDIGVAGKTVNTASNKGGGIYDASANRLEITNSRIVNNYGYYHAAYSSGGTSASGGGIYTETADVSLIGCTVSDNVLYAYTSDGGGVYCGGSLALTNSTVANNTFSYHTGPGGGLYVAGGLTISGVNVISGNMGSTGGGIYANGGLTAGGDCTVSGNNASKGAGIYIGSDTTSSLTNCTVSDNGLNSPGSGVWIDTGAGVEIKDCVFTGNKGDRGGAVHNDGRLVMTDCDLIGNEGNSFGGGIYNSGTLTTTSCDFTENTGVYGGGICNYQGTAEAIDCQFYNNTSAGYAGGGGGGGICNMGTLTATRCDFIKNKATTSLPPNPNASGVGGGVFNSGTFKATDCNFTENEAIFRGGTLYNVGGVGGGVYSSGTFTAANCDFTGNKAVSGGAIYLNYASATPSCTITGGKIDRNISTGTGANDGGGGIWVAADRRGQLRVDRTTFVRNKAVAAYDIAAADIPQHNAQITNCGPNYSAPFDKPAPTINYTYNNYDIFYRGGTLNTDPIAKYKITISYYKNSVSIGNMLGAAVEIPSVTDQSAIQTAVMVALSKVNWEDVLNLRKPTGDWLDGAIDEANSSGYAISPFDVTSYIDGGNVIISIVYEYVGEPEPDTYAVTYNANWPGGIAGTGSAPTDGNTYEEGETVLVKAPSGMYKAGYAFLGWAYAHNATEPDFAVDGATVTPANFEMGDDNLTLYGVWAAVPVIDQLSKTAASENYVAGSPMNYTISFILPDNIKAIGSIRIDDVYLGANLKFVELVSAYVGTTDVKALVTQSGPTASAIKMVSFTLDGSALVAGKTVTLVLTFEIDEDAEGAITNTAELYVTPKNGETPQTPDATDTETILEKIVLGGSITIYYYRGGVAPANLIDYIYIPADYGEDVLLAIREYVGCTGDEWLDLFRGAGYGAGALAAETPMLAIVEGDVFFWVVYPTGSGNDVVTGDTLMLLPFVVLSLSVLLAAGAVVIRKRRKSVQ